MTRLLIEICHSAVRATMVAVTPVHARDLRASRTRATPPIPTRAAMAGASAVV